jgi:uncharacterized protein YkwD
MAIRGLHTVALLALASLAAGMIGVAGLPATAEAGGSGACRQWADAHPEQLSNGEARAAVLCLVNRKRSRAGLRPLERDRNLQRAAQRHNNRMVGSGCFSHQCSGEADLGGRLKSTGYLSGKLRRWAYGENIAWGMERRGTPAAVVDAWMGSPPHRANILSGSFRELGVGFATGSPSDAGDRGGIYTIDFGVAVG